MNKKDEIKKFLKSNPNGLLILSRQVGKTQALVELLYEDKKAKVLVMGASHREHFIGVYRKYMLFLGILFQDNMIKDRVIHSIKQGERINMEEFYIDEYFHHNTFYKIFKGAVASMKFPIKIIPMSYDAEELELLIRARKALNDDQFRLEYSMDFDK